MARQSRKIIEGFWLVRCVLPWELFITLPSDTQPRRTIYMSTTTYKGAYISPTSISYLQVFGPTYKTTGSVKIPWGAEKHFVQTGAGAHLTCVDWVIPTPYNKTSRSVVHQGTQMTTCCLYQAFYRRMLVTLENSWQMCWHRMVNEKINTCVT